MINFPYVSDFGECFALGWVYFVSRNSENIFLNTTQPRHDYSSFRVAVDGKEEGRLKPNPNMYKAAYFLLLQGDRYKVSSHIKNNVFFHLTKC